MLNRRQRSYSLFHVPNNTECSHGLQLRFANKHFRVQQSRMNHLISVKVLQKFHQIGASQKETCNRGLSTLRHRNREKMRKKNTGVQPRWIQGDSKVGGQSRHLWKNTYLITDRERLEMDSVVGRLVEKRRLNNLDYVE